MALISSISHSRGGDAETRLRISFQLAHRRPACCAARLSISAYIPPPSPDDSDGPASVSAAQPSAGSRCDPREQEGDRADQRVVGEDVAAPDADTCAPARTGTARPSADNGPRAALSPLASARSMTSSMEAPNRKENRPRILPSTRTKLKARRRCPRAPCRPRRRVRIGRASGMRRRRCYRQYAHHRDAADDVESQVPRCACPLRQGLIPRPAWTAAGCSSAGPCARSSRTGSRGCRRALPRRRGFRGRGRG